MAVLERAIAARNEHHNLTGPQTDTEQLMLSIAIVVASSLSIIGAGWVILSFACFNNLRLFRHKLILGLAISDFLRALDILVPAVMDLRHQSLDKHSDYNGCLANGFIVQLFVTQSDYWVLMIAIYTCIIVTGQRHIAAWMHSHQLIVMGIPWAISLTSAGVSMSFANYDDIGSWCWIQDEETRLLYNIVPRWAIILAMLVMYARISFVLLTAQKYFGKAVSKQNAAGGPRSLLQNTEVMDSFEPLTVADMDGQCSVQQNSIRLRKLSRHMALYPIVYIVLWILPTAVCLYHTVKKTRAPYALQTVDKSFIVIQGFVNAITYGVSESSVACWRTLIGSEDAMEPAEHGDQSPPNSPRRATGPEASRPSMPSPLLSKSAASDSLSGTTCDEYEGDIESENGPAPRNERASVRLKNLNDPAENHTQISFYDGRAGTCAPPNINIYSNKR